MTEQMNCMGVCGKPWAESPFCPDCLADIKRWSETGEVEVFVPVPDRNCYMVSSWGQVKSLDRVVIVKDPRGAYARRVKGRMLRTTFKDNRYPHVSLSLGSSVHDIEVHRLALEAFVGPCPAGLEVCHGDDVATNNRLYNLRYDTHGGNQADQVRNGRHYWANKTHCPAGHEYTPENTGRHGGGGRFCRICARKSNRETYRRNAEAVNARRRERRRLNPEAINARERQRYHERKQALREGQPAE